MPKIKLSAPFLSESLNNKEWTHIRYGKTPGNQKESLYMLELPHEPKRYYTKTMYLALNESGEYYISNDPYGFHGVIIHEAMVGYKPEAYEDDEICFSKIVQVEVKDYKQIKAKYEYMISVYNLEKKVFLSMKQEESEYQANNNIHGLKKRIEMLESELAELRGIPLGTTKCHSTS